MSINKDKDPTVLGTLLYTFGGGLFLFIILGSIIGGLMLGVLHLLGYHLELPKH